MLNTFKDKCLWLLIAGVTALECKVAQANVTQGHSQSVADVSTGLLAPVSLFTKTLYNICYILGAMLIMGSIVQYRDHRNNSSQVPLSRPVFMLLLGLLLIAIPAIGHLSAGSSFLN